MKPLISMLAILVALGAALGVYLLAYWYHRKTHPHDDPRDR